MESTLKQLLKRNCIDNIRVTDIIGETGICKGTFYKYYQDKYDLLMQTFENFFYKEITQDCNGPEQFIENCLKVFRRDPVVVFNAFRSQDVNSMRSYQEMKYRSYIEQSRKKKGYSAENIYVEYAIGVFVREVSEILLAWLKGSCKEEDEAVMRMIGSIIPVSLYKEENQKKSDKERRNE